MSGLQDRFSSYYRYVIGVQTEELIQEAEPLMQVLISFHSALQFGVESKISLSIFQPCITF